MDTNPGLFTFIYALILFVILWSVLPDSIKPFVAFSVVFVALANTEGATLVGKTLIDTIFAPFSPQGNP